MSAPKHTPGPWFFDGNRIDSKEYVVAEVFGVSLATRNANSHLVAAAPDLLAVAKRVGCQDLGLCGPSEPDGLCFVCAAIAKAEGRS